MKIEGSGSISLVRGVDPRIRIQIRIHTKMSWIRNTEFYLRIRGTAHQRTATCPSRAAPAHSLQRASEALRRCPDRYTYFLLEILLTIQALLFLELQGDFLDFFSYMYGIQHCFICHPLRFHCVGGCWDRTQDFCDFGIGSSQTL
jgi:hypothetical protein